jgi:alkanesulfonate monooxygenase SsuD/methylene tetrahydromethanopterin reductase-like flavin-dependent oxidoreductase (luciferase family)
MRFGAFLRAAQFPGQDHTLVLESTIAAAVAAEEAGFDDVWVAEHHFSAACRCCWACTPVTLRKPRSSVVTTG